LQLDNQAKAKAWGGLEALLKSGLVWQAANA
jgi:hypothetical protein